MRLRLFGLLVGVAVFPTSAIAAPVVVMRPGGRTVAQNDPFVSGSAITPAPMLSQQPSAATSASPRAAFATASSSGRGRQPTHKRKRKPTRTVTSELARLDRSHVISQSAYQGYLVSWNAALGAERRLRGVRRSELTAVTETLHNIAASKLLTPARLPVLFLTLDRNVQYWKTGPLLGYGQRVEFTGSQLVWEYYPGQGIQLQVLGTFGKADALYTAGPSQYAILRELLGEMIPLAVIRGGSLAWEYYFTFGGGTPPWTSAMSQGTALEALPRGYLSLGGASDIAGVPNYLAIARQALGIFSVQPPTGVGVKTPVGTRFLQYSFASARSQEVINAFLQSLIGLYDYAQASGDPTAAALFAAGNAEAQAELPQFDTGAWSLYQPGQEDTLDYHDLVTGFLQTLCTMTSVPVYCTTAQHFQAYLTTAPTLSLLTGRLPLHKPGTIRFSLSKISRVGIVVTRGAQTVLATSASFSYGAHSFSLPAQRHAGQLAVRLSATDLAGNFSRITGTIGVTR